MTNLNLTYVAVILDESGSMAAVKSDTIGGLNTFIDQQKQVQGDVSFTLNTFSNLVKPIFSNTPIKDIPVLTDKHYSPNGGTALFDAIGLTIDEIGKYLSSLNEDQRPNKVIIAILTDGEENASKKFNSEMIKAEIRHQTDIYSWEFVFLAANQDAIAAASSVGIAGSHSMNYASSGRGTQAAFRSLSSNVSATRSAGASMAFTPEHRVAYDSAAGVNVNSTQSQAVTHVPSAGQVLPWQTQKRHADGKFGSKIN